ncbi:hypothetical protein [Robbsia andropogonis]|uniref:hypothetical protein n=1 Tax=Robbsia andropogonis TaxID=28092 RepID=UPI0004648E68|nr:hypothetical protein [Robbsia andropogonis]
MLPTFDGQSRWQIREQRDHFISGLACFAVSLLLRCTFLPFALVPRGQCMAGQCPIFDIKTIRILVVRFAI